MRRGSCSTDDAWQYFRSLGATSDDPRRYDGIELCDWERKIRWDDSDADSDAEHCDDPERARGDSTRPVDSVRGKKEARRPPATTSRRETARDPGRCAAIFERGVNPELDDDRWLDAVLWDGDEGRDVHESFGPASPRDGHSHRPCASSAASRDELSVDESRVGDVRYGDGSADGSRPDSNESPRSIGSPSRTRPPPPPPPPNTDTIESSRFDAVLDMAAIVRGETDWRARLQRERAQTPYNVSNDSFYERAPDHHRHPLMDAAAAAGVVVSDRVARVQKIVAIVRDLDYLSGLRSPGARSFPYRSRLAQLERFGRPTIGGADDVDGAEWDGDGSDAGRKKPSARNRLVRRPPPTSSSSASEFSLSCGRGAVILTEHLEQHPSLLQLPGMSTAIAHYWRPVSDAAPSRPRAVVAATAESVRRGAATTATPLDAIRKRQALADALERIAQRPTAAIFPTVRLEPEDASPLVLGDLAPGTCTAVLENSLYRAPAHEHTSAHTQHSFLLVRTRVAAAAAAADASDRPAPGAYRWRLNVVRGWFALGQQQPKREVPLPHEMAARNIFAHQKVARFVRGRLEDGLPVDLQSLTAVFGRRAQPLLKTMLAAGIREHQERTQKRLGRVGAATTTTTTTTTAPHSKSRSSGGDDNGKLDDDDDEDDDVEDEDEKKRKLTQLCAYEAMLGAAYRLRHILALGVLDLTGLARLVALFDRRTHAAELRVLSHIQRELQMAPWSQTRAFLSGTSRGGLTLQGRGNPLPNRAGFALVIQTGITYNKGPRVAPVAPASASSADTAAAAVARRKKRRRESAVSPSGARAAPPPPPGSNVASRPGEKRRALSGGGGDDDDKDEGREKSATREPPSTAVVAAAAVAATKRGDLRKLTMASMHAELRSFNVAENGYATTKRWDCVKLLKRLRQGNQLQERRDFGPEERPTAVRGTREYVAPAQYERLVRNILARQVQLIASPQPPRYPPRLSAPLSTTATFDAEHDEDDDRKRSATSGGDGGGVVVFEHPWVDEVDRDLLAGGLPLFASRGGRLAMESAGTESVQLEEKGSAPPHNRASGLAESKRAPPAVPTGASLGATATTRKKKIVRVPVVVRRHTYLDPASQKVVSVVTHSRRTELVAALAAAIDAIRAGRATPTAAATSASDQESASSLSPELRAFYRAIDADRGATGGGGGRGESFEPPSGAYFFDDRPCAVSRVRPPPSTTSAAGTAADDVSEKVGATNDDAKSLAVGDGGGTTTTKKKSGKPRVAKRRNKLACLRSIKLFSGSGKPMFPLSAHDEREYRLQNRDIFATADAVAPTTPTPSSGSRSGAAKTNRSGGGGGGGRRAPGASRTRTRKDGDNGDGDAGRRRKTSKKKKRRRRRGSSESESDASEREDGDEYLEGDVDSDDVEDTKTLADDVGSEAEDDDDDESEWLPKKRARKSAATAAPPAPPAATRSSHSVSVSAAAGRKTARSVPTTVAVPAAVAAVAPVPSVVVGSLRTTVPHRTATRKRVRTAAAQSLAAAGMPPPPQPPPPPPVSTHAEGAKTLAPSSATRSKTRRR